MKYDDEYKILENQIKLALSLFVRGFNRASKLKIKAKNVFIFGIGASWLAAKAFIDLFSNSLKRPVFLSNTYVNSITKNDLAIFISYSGKTKEILGIYRKVKKKTKNIIFVTSNYKIKEKTLLVDVGLLSRTAMPFMLGCLVGLFKDDIGLTKKEVMGVLSLAKHITKIKNEARFIADYIWRNYYKKIIFLSDIEALALRLKNQINENAKLTLQVAYFPEAYHNEIEANHDALIIYAKKTKRVEKFIKLSKSDLIFVDAKEKNLLSFFYGLLLVDYISLYLSMHNKVNPIETNKINEIKKI